ncbi:hypothetical protein [Chitinophaga sp. YIM B06452]|uniref:hypothetical protein n=1 Tax=Chitinophaga sp. YIM B06452 TaxID=3082158 RepID=UPI0031FE936B
MKIPTYIINLKSRSDRLENVMMTFENRHEFEITVVEAIRREAGALGLWNTIQHILRDLTRKEYEYVLICEDDHVFTEHYSRETLFESIAAAREEEADILCGGVSWVSNIAEMKHGIFWVEKFSGLQFCVIFRKFFDRLLGATFPPGGAADYMISDLSDKKFFTFPFISIQKDFGYSDVTPPNTIAGAVRELFEKSTATVNIARKVMQHYKNAAPSAVPETFEDVTIPVYILNLPERTDRLIHIKKQFEGKDEFAVAVIEACKHEIGATGLWLSIRKAVQLAVANDEDVVIICEDDHEFTKDYTKEYLIRNIIEANEQGLDMLIGGVIDMNTALPVATNRYWVSSFWSTQFIVLYRNMFRPVLDETFDTTVTADGKLSEIVINKAVLFPFVSVQREFGYSDVSPSHDAFRTNKPNDEKFRECIGRFQRIREIHTRSMNSL